MGRERLSRRDTKEVIQLADKARASKTPAEALVISAANLLLLGRSVAKGIEMRALQEHCYEFLEDTGYDFPRR